MFFKYYEDSRRKAVDLNDVYLNQSLFILGGSPTLNDENLELLKQRGILTLAINNVAAKTFHPNFWVSGDRPDCYAENILVDPSILKFVNMGKRDFQFRGKAWKYQPATLFYACREKLFTTKNFLDKDYRLCWWKNTFFIALQLAWRLGFRRIYLLGCEFKISKEKQYAWNTDLRSSEVNANKRLYSNSVRLMGEMKALFESHGFQIFNCCKTSMLVPAFGFLDLESAVKEATAVIPKDVDTCLLPHSLRKENS